MKNPYQFLLLCLALICSQNSQAAEDWPGSTLMESDVVCYDADNYLSYSRGHTSTSTLILHIAKDGENFDWLLDKLVHTVGMRVVFSIQYASKDTIWIISRLGRRKNGATLLNLTTREKIKSFAGQHFFISPDAQHVAYTVQVRSQYKVPSGHFIYIDDMMVFPQRGSVLMRGSFPEAFLDGSALPITSNIWVDRNLLWLDNNTIRILINDDWISSSENKYKQSFPQGEYYICDLQTVDYSRENMNVEVSTSTLISARQKLHTSNIEDARVEFLKRGIADYE